MGMGRSGRSLRGHPAYTDPFPSTLRKLVILVEHYSLRRGIPACSSTAARVFMARGSSPWHKHSWRALSMSRRHSASRWPRPYQLGAPTMTPRGYVAQQAAYQSTRRCLPQGRSEQARRGAIASSWADCTTIASLSRHSARARQRCITVAMPLYYVISSSRLLLVCHSKQISKTASKQKPNSSFATTETPSCHSFCQRPLLCRPPVALAHPPPTPRAHAETLARSICQRSLASSTSFLFLTPGILQRDRQTRDSDLRAHPKCQRVQLFAFPNSDHAQKAKEHTSLPPKTPRPSRSRRAIRPSEQLNASCIFLLPSRRTKRNVSPHTRLSVAKAAEAQDKHSAGQLRGGTGWRTARAAPNERQASAGSYDLSEFRRMEAKSPHFTKEAWSGKQVTQAKDS